MAEAGAESAATVAIAVLGLRMEECARGGTCELLNAAV